MAATRTMNSRKQTRLLLLGYRRPIEELEIKKAGKYFRTVWFQDKVLLLLTEGLTLFGSVDIEPRSGLRTPSTGRERERKCLSVSDLSYENIEVKDRKSVV